jgi:hypothetical protein
VRSTWNPAELQQERRRMFNVGLSTRLNFHFLNFKVGPQACDIVVWFGAEVLFVFSAEM